ncbi:hypothetical protein BC830DRAFT_1169762 [Chytriomyces sp. MP71]|nr:hypothetical protein BC830DRAFT_1169762 [Chytriomyces sp. MP71]
MTLFQLNTDKKASSVLDSASAKRRSWSLGFSLKRASNELLPMSPELEFAVKLIGSQNAHALKPSMSETDLYCLTHQKFQVRELPLCNQVQIANAFERLILFRDSGKVQPSFRQFRVPKRRRGSPLRVVEPDFAPTMMEGLDDLEDVIPLYYFSK